MHKFAFNSITYLYVLGSTRADLAGVLGEM